MISAYCADSATDDPVTWAAYMRHIAGLVRPGGTLITAALCDTSWYQVGGRRFPSAGIGLEDLRGVLETDFDLAGGRPEVRNVADAGSHGYSSIVLASARRSPGATERQAA